MTDGDPSVRQRKGRGGVCDADSRALKHRQRLCAAYIFDIGPLRLVY